jgi:hypothetical protein
MPDSSQRIETMASLAERILRENMTDHDQLVKAALVFELRREALVAAQGAYETQRQHLLNLWRKWDAHHPVVPGD